MGANLCPEEDLDKPITNLKEILPYTEGFHRRYMNSNKVCRFWVNMVKQLDIEIIAPQHGRSYSGKAIGEFFDWIEELECGMDLFTQNNYRLP